MRILLIVRKIDIIKLSNIVNENEFLGFLKIFKKNNYFFKKKKLDVLYFIENKSEDEVFRTFKKIKKLISNGKLPS